MLVEGGRLGGYEVLGLLGAGGMGEVYSARDTRLDRDVALKVLPDDLAQDPERRRRFEREARALAALSHPGIAVLHGLEEAEGVLYLVMELVEGPTLAERLKAGPLRLSEALGLAQQTADALEAAHEGGILHRDLKPQNIKVTPEGRVKLLDFGLAKVMAEHSREVLSEKPTVTADATGLGVVMGTAPYMSPEQARGEAVDRRTDVWAFGCVLYELLSARRAFPGPSRSDALAAVLEREPDWEALPPSTPPSIRKLLRRSLEKDKARRLHDIGDARLEIEEAQVELSSGAGPAAVSGAHRRPTALLWAGGLLAAAMGGLVTWIVLRALPSGATATRLTFVPPPGVGLMDEASPYQHLAVSPRGDRVAFIGWDGNEPSLNVYVQALDDLEGRAVAGTDHVSNPFFSPDGHWLGFADRGKLKKVLLEGGAPITIADVPGWLRGASWGSDGTIVYSADPHPPGLWRVAADGGIPQAIAIQESSGVGYRWPQLLPGGRELLVTMYSGGHASIGILSLETGKKRVVVEGAGYARYSATGHLVYGRLGALLAVPFDAERLEVTGPAVPVLDDVRMAIDGYADFDISASGSLAYVPGFRRPVNRSLLWVDRQGHATPINDRRLPYDHARLSPDGRRIVARVETEPGSGALWILDRLQDAWAPVASVAQTNPRSPEWSPDGGWIAFVSNAGGKRPLRRVLADGSAPAEDLLGSPTTDSGFAWLRDGRVLVRTATGLEIVSVEKGEPLVVRAPPDVDCCAALSPDGRFLAYVSSESQFYEVYVRPFPGLGEKVRLSMRGAGQPRWSRDGRELFYRQETSDRPKLMAVAVETRGGFRAGTPRPLFDDTFAGRAPWDEAGYDVAQDGRFLFLEEPKAPRGPSRLVLIPAWGSELKTRLRAARP